RRNLCSRCSNRDLMQQPVSECSCRQSTEFGHLRPFMPQKTRVGNDRSQSTTDVARRRNRNEKLYKAGARSSVTLAAQNADRRAAVSEIELALSTLSGLRALRKPDVQRTMPAAPSGRSTPILKWWSSSH